MARIRLPADVVRELKIWDLSETLGLETAVCVGYVVVLLGWLARQMPNGNLGEFDESVYASIAGMRHRSAKREKLFGAWVRKNLLDANGRVVDWEKYIGGASHHLLRKQNPERSRMNLTVRSMVLERDGFMCRRCGAGPREARLKVDHVVPLIRGGRSEMGNLQTLCQDCNGGKGDRLPTSHDLTGRRGDGLDQ